MWVLTHVTNSKNSFFVKRSQQYIRIKNPLHKQSESACASKRDVLELGTLRYVKKKDNKGREGLENYQFWDNVIYGRLPTLSELVCDGSMSAPITEYLGRKSMITKELLLLWRCLENQFVWSKLKNRPEIISSDHFFLRCDIKTVNIWQKSDKNGQMIPVFDRMFVSCSYLENK